MICHRRRTGILSRLQQQHHSTTTTWTAVSSPARQPHLIFQRPQFRPYSDNKPSNAPPPPSTPRQPAPGAEDVSIPSAVSSATPGISQPLSTPEGVHTEAHPGPQPGKPRESSSCPPGTKLHGLNYEKNKPELFAGDDSEYPEWLWGLLDEMEKKSEIETGGVDPRTLNKKGRKRLEKKMAAQAAALPPKIPVHHEATDITPASYNRGDQPVGELIVEAAESIEKRTQITKSARAARRQGIREANFLRGL